jgi:hypothetical protein
MSATSQRRGAAAACPRARLGSPTAQRGAFRRGALFLGLFLLAGLLPAAASAAETRLLAEGDSGVSLRGGPFLPYAIIEAELLLPGGFRGSLLLEGITWEGKAEALFAGRAEAWTESFSLAFYLDEEFRSLRLGLGSSGSPSFRSLEFLLPLEPGGSPAEEAATAALRRLPTPVRSSPRGAPPELLSLNGGSATAAALSAAGEAFAARSGGASMPILALSGLLAALLAGWSGPAAARRILAICLSCAALLGLALAYPGEALLYRIALPSAEGRLEGSFRLAESRAPGLRTLAWGVDGAAAQPPGLSSPGVSSPGLSSPGLSSPGLSAPSLELVGIDAPEGAGLDPSFLAGAGDRLRFARAPLFRGGAAGNRLESNGFLCGWVLHAGD